MKLVIKNFIKITCFDPDFSISKVFGGLSMNLIDVCESLLDNADLRVDLSAYPAVTLNMLVKGAVNGRFWKVIFECGQVVHMDAEFDDDSSHGDLFMVLEVSVDEIIKKKTELSLQSRMGQLNEDAPVWSVRLFGDMSLTMVTTEFNWQLIELSLDDYEAAYV